MRYVNLIRFPIWIHPISSNANPSDLGSCDFGPWRTSENATKYLSCLLQPAAHEKLKLANLQGWILKTHWSIHMEEKKTLPRISHVLIELKSKRLLQRLIKQREKGWGIQYFHWPIPVFIGFIYIAYVYLLYSYIVYVFLFHNFDQTRGISDWDHCKQSLTKLGGFLIETTVNNLKSLILNTRILL